jgi:DDE_Tnp_1-associated
MNCSTKEKQAGRIKREINAEGVEYDCDSVFERFGQLTDIRKARGKRFSLEAILTIIVMAKMCGEDTPSAIADWAKNHQEQILELLQLKRPKLPHYD